MKEISREAIQAWCDRAEWLGLEILDSYEGQADDPRGIVKFIAYAVSLAAVRERYARSYDNVASDLAAVEDLRVLDFNGHQIMTNFSLSELGEPIKFES